MTGGCGFIGSNYVRRVLRERPEDSVVNLDKLTYAGNPENLADVAGDPRYSFLRADICDENAVEAAMARVDAVVNFAAESHVDRSIQSAGSFVDTDIKGVYTLLEAARKRGIERFLHVSTDEVYGSIEAGSFSEDDPLDPSSPYSASKAGGELMVRAFARTFGYRALITRGSNTYGPYQYPEKMIPLFITNAIDSQPLPLYGDGLNVRDWLHVLDHCRAIDVVIERGVDGEVYNIGGGNEVKNLALTRQILKLLGKSPELIRFVSDRPGHDRRYSIDCGKLQALGWHPATPFQTGLERTVSWYRDNPGWWRKIKSGEWREYYEQQYAELG